MVIIIDANKLFSIIITRSATLDLFFNSKLEIVSPDFVIDEITDHLDEIILKSKLSKEEIFSFIVLVSYKIRFFRAGEYKEFLNRAQRITKDADDVDYLA